MKTTASALGDTMFQAGQMAADLVESQLVHVSPVTFLAVGAAGRWLARVLLFLSCPC